VPLSLARECALSEEPGLPSCPVQAGHAAPSAHGSCFPSLWPREEGPVCRWDHRWRAHPTRPDGCMAGNPAVQAPSCPSEQATQLLTLPRNRHGSSCGHHAHKGPCVRGVHLRLQENIWELAPVDSFARCGLAPSGWWTPGVSSRLDEWLFNRLMSRLSLVLCPSPSSCSLSRSQINKILKKT